MKLPDNQAVVVDIAGSRAVVACNEPSVRVALHELGFAPEGAHLVRAIADDSDRQALVKELIRLDALFSSGRDWSPAELLDFYRDQRIVTSQYKVIAWRNPSDFVIVTK